MKKNIYKIGLIASLIGYTAVCITTLYISIKRENAEAKLNQLVAGTQVESTSRAEETCDDSSSYLPNDSSVPEKESIVPADSSVAKLTDSSISTSTESVISSSVESTSLVVEDTEAADAANTVDVLTERGIIIPEKNINWADLQGQNPDIYAWIYVPNTHIDYPILQHPYDKSYYLMHNIDHSEGYPGCIYTHNVNPKDWSDPNTVIYGHNMNNGSMFHDLHKFEDGSFFEFTPFVYIYTPEGTKVYEIFASYPFPNVDLNMCFDYSTPDAAQMYFDGIWTNTGWTSHFRENITLDGYSRIITLTTCIGGQADMRYLVQAVLINP